MLTVQRVCQNIVLGVLTFIMFGMGTICAAIGSTNHAAGYLLVGATLCCVLAWLKDRWLKEEEKRKS